MNISNSQIDILRRDVRAGLRALFRPEPQTAVEWADASYYLPKESAYQEGRWETLPFQRAIMNAMGSDYIREVNVVKSARVGYSKMLLGVYAYFIEHKQRNTLIWLPTDGDAENFMKTHVEPTIRDIPSLLALAPWYGKKHRDNTLTMKRFTNGRGFWCLGGKAAKNYREKSVDVAGYDELAAFDDDIEQKGSPTFLGDKRIEGSVWPKSIRGSTPKVRGTCQIERAASESPHFMRFQTIWCAITAMPPTPSSCIRIISSGLFSGSVIAQAGAIWASGRKKPVPFPARLKRHGKSLPRMTAAALTLSENARLP